VCDRNQLIGLCNWWSYFSPDRYSLYPLHHGKELKDEQTSLWPHQTNQMEKNLY